MWCVARVTCLVYVMYAIANVIFISGGISTKWKGMLNVGCHIVYASMCLPQREKDNRSQK